MTSRVRRKESPALSVTEMVARIDLEVTRIDEGLARGRSS